MKIGQDLQFQKLFGNHEEANLSVVFVIVGVKRNCYIVEGLTADIALQSARASEVVVQEAKAMQELPPEQPNEQINQR